MGIINAIVAEFDHECTLTRRMLERVPDDKWGWKPHEKSMSLQQLDGHLAEIPMWVEATCTMDVFEMAPGSYQPFLPETSGALLAAFDDFVAKARALMLEESDEHLMQNWTMKMGDQVMVSMPRVAVLRAFILSHTIHHRAQLGLYLRMNDVALPATYGPSADEQG